MRPKVTVIVLTYNQEDTIARTLDSILAQKVTYDYEILIGDDASSDSTRDVCVRYQESYPDVIRLMPEAPNKGVADNYFDCVEAARGEYIADCAGDDWWVATDKLQREADFLDAHPEVALVHTAWRPVDADTGCEGADVVLDMDEVTAGREVLEALLTHRQPQPIHLCTAMYRREMLMAEYRAAPGLFRGRCAEDLPIMAMLSASHPIGYIPEVTLNYSVGSDSVSNSARAARAAAFYRESLQLTADLAARTGVPLQEIAAGLRRYHAYALSLAVRSGSREAVRSLEAVRRSIGVRPTIKSRVRSLLSRIFSLYLPQIHFHQ